MTTYPYFSSEDVDVSLLGDGNLIALNQELSFFDKNKKKWWVFQGFKSDGASIPKTFWSIIGSPLTGKYRKSAIIHDKYCDLPTEKFQDVHKMFYEACLCEGLDVGKAKLMYWAVLHFGPEWNQTKIDNVRWLEESFKKIQNIQHKLKQKTTKKEKLESLREVIDIGNNLKTTKHINLSSDKIEEIQYLTEQNYETFYTLEANEDDEQIENLTDSLLKTLNITTQILKPEENKKNIWKQKEQPTTEEIKKAQDIIQNLELEDIEKLTLTNLRKYK